MAEGYALWGGYGGNNLGDEAILWAMSQLLRRLDPATPQYVLLPSGASEVARAQYAAWGIQTIAEPLSRCLLRVRTLRVIVGGGQMVDDSSHMWPVGGSSLFLGADRLFGQHPLVLCVGAEPLTKRFAKVLVRHVYGLADRVTCRDEESATVLRSTGLSPAKIETTRDVVFSLDRQMVPQWTAGRSDGKTVALLVAFDPARIREGVSGYVALASALGARGFRVVLVAHDLRPEYDPRALAEVKEACAGDSLVEVARVTSVPEVFELYSRVDAVISGRMHPLIMGMLAGTLPVAYGGKAKVQSLLSMSPIPAIASGGDPQVQVAQLEELLSQRDELLPRLAETARLFRQNVESSTSRALRWSSLQGRAG